MNFVSSELKSGWKPFKGLAGLKLDAFSAGLDALGNNIYIGRGKFNGVLTPGQLLLEQTGKTRAGLYVMVNSTQYRISSNIEYYSVDPSCDYQWISSMNGNVVENAVEVDATKKFYIGRVLVKGSYHVGTVVVKSKMFYLPRFSANKYEVLVCQSNEKKTSNFPIMKTK